MSVGPMSGVVGSAAGAPLSQTAGSESERARKDSSASQRQVENDAKAENSAGIGQTEADEGTSDRDADGRKLWEGDAPQGNQQQPPPDSEPEPPRQAKDPTGDSGSELDLTG